MISFHSQLPAALREISCCDLFGSDVHTLSAGTKGRRNILCLQMRPLLHPAPTDPIFLVTIWLLFSHLRNAHVVPSWSLHPASTGEWPHGVMMSSWGLCPPCSMMSSGTSSTRVDTCVQGLPFCISPLVSWWGGSLPEDWTPISHKAGRNTSPEVETCPSPPGSRLGGLWKQPCVAC